MPNDLDSLPPSVVTSCVIWAETSRYRIKSYGLCPGPSLAKALCLSWDMFFFHSGSCSQTMKLRSMQHKLYSMAKNWRSENLLHRSTSHPGGEKDFILKSKDKERRREANDGEACALVHLGRRRAFRGSGVSLSFYPFLVLHFRLWPPVGVSFNSLM